MERANMIKNVRSGKFPDEINTNYKNLLKRLIHRHTQKRPDTSQLIEIMNKLSSNKDHVIHELQQQLSERDVEIKTLKAEVEGHKRNRDRDVRGKDLEIEQLKARILEMEKKIDFRSDLEHNEKEINRLKNLERDLNFN